MLLVGCVMAVAAVVSRLPLSNSRLAEMGWSVALAGIVCAGLFSLGRLG